MGEKKKITIAGLSLGPYAIVFAVTMISAYLKVLPGGMVGGFLLTIVLGELFDLIGNKTPIINSYFGGGAIVAIILGSALVYYELLPEQSINTVTTFMKGGGFLNFYIAALITGSILGMDRGLLIKASVRYLPVIIGGVVAALGLVSLASFIVGYTPKEAIAYVGIPIMGGGMGAGAVPISKIFAETLNTDTQNVLNRLVPAVALGNALAIVAGGLLNRLGKVRPKLTGNGQLLPLGDTSLVYKEKTLDNTDFTTYMKGIVVATAFFAFGSIVSKLIGMLGLKIHLYAWMIISVAIVKALNILPAKYENACAVWYKFVAKNFTAALLLGIGIAYTNLGQIISAMTFQYIFLVLVVVIGAIIGSGFVGKLVGFYPIEAAITGGLCMANMGGTGDVAVLTAANRMQLMPFAQISSRIGGALIILLASFLVPIFFG